MPARRMVLEGAEGCVHKEVWKQQSDLKLLSGLRAVLGARGHETGHGTVRPTPLAHAKRLRALLVWAYER